MLQRTSSGQLYDVLELDRTCSTAEVSQQYRRLALRYHPDRNNGATVEQFQRIEEAHRVLSDPQQRQLYDAVGREGLKQLGDYGGGMVGSLLLAVGNLAAGCLLLGILSAALFVSLLVGCSKIDAPSEWPSWGVVLIPIWFFLPLLVLASLMVMAASLKRGLYVLLLPSVRLLLCVVIAATTAAALDHRISAISAFIPWIIWYVLGTVSDVVMMVPTVYRRTHSPSFAEDSANAAMGGGNTNSAQDHFGSQQHTTAAAAAADGGAGRSNSATATNSNASVRSDNESFVTTPWRTRQYWRDLAELVVEAVCVYAFLALAFQRALQQQQHQRKKAKDDTAGGDGGVTLMSFWVVFTPLLVFFALHLVANVYEGYTSSPSEKVSASSPTSPLNTAAAFREGESGQHHQTHHRTDSHSSAASSSSSSMSHRRPASCGERVSNSVLRASPAACGLYMAAMWAAKAEYEYNGVKRGLDPSAFLAFLPILVVLGALAFFVCCGGCLVICLGSAVMAMGEEGGGAGQSASAAAASAASSPSATQSPPHPHPHRSSGRSSPSGAQSEGYNSTSSRSPHAPGGRASPVRRSNTAKDVTLEQID